MKPLLLILFLFSGLCNAQYAGLDVSVNIPDAEHSDQTGFGIGWDIHIYQPIKGGILDMVPLSFKDMGERDDFGEGGERYLFFGTGIGYLIDLRNEGAYLGPAVKAGYQHLNKVDFMAGAEFLHTGIDPIKFGFSAHYSPLNKHFIFGISFGAFFWK